MYLKSVSTDKKLLAGTIAAALIGRVVGGIGGGYLDKPDFDNDGIEDDLDNCPWGQDDSMPDSDGDRVIDDCDTCPQHSGPTVTNGCPVP